MIRILMCGPIAKSGGVSTHTKNLMRELNNLNVELIPFNLSGKSIDDIDGSDFIKLYQRTLGLVLKSITLRNKYDIIHVQASGGMTSFIAAITGALISRILRKRIVITFHYSKTEKFVKNNINLFKFVLKSVNYLILVSNKQKEVISELYPEYHTKLKVIPNGYKSELFYPRDSNYCKQLLGLQTDKKIILNVSNLIESKGHLYLIKAMENIIDYDKNVTCFIVGQGKLKDELNALIKRLDLADYVKLVGWQPDEQIPIWMNACDIFVLPSLAEGNPIVLVECLGCGKPFIGTKVGGIPEIINSPDYGILCDPANHTELGDRLIYALNYPWNIVKIKEYSDQFKWDSIALMTKEIYKDLY